MNHLRLLQDKFGSGEGRALYRMVMEERFGLSQTDLLLCKDTKLSADEQQELSEIVSRLLKNEPIQYVLGYTDFCGHRFFVRPGCLIPRPETEEFVRLIVRSEERRVKSGELTLQLLDEKKTNTFDSQLSTNKNEFLTLSSSLFINRTYSVLDVGTGSGCIAISLALEGFFVTAIDISDEALAVASENAERLGANVRFVKENILHLSSTLNNAKWDAIVSNPPYVCEREATEMSENVLDYEPHLALFVPDSDPLLFYRKIAEFGLNHLTKNGCLFFEINQQFGAEMIKMLSCMGYKNVKITKDQYGKDRFATAQL